MNLFAYLKISFLALCVLAAGCEKKYSPEDEAYVESIEMQRARKDSLMEMAENSPFNYKEKVEFHPLKYFDVDPKYIYESKLYEYATQDTISVFGTKGEERKTVRVGYLKFSRDGKEFKLNVYKNQGVDGQVYYGIWFTDLTTNNETYGVGRYLDFEKIDDKEHIYTIDFNLAYNPYCAYSAAYSCAIPTKEDHLNVAIYAGEKKFHD